MNILSELPDIQILDRQLAEAEKLATNISSSLPTRPSTNIEGIFDGNLQELLGLVRKRVELFQRIDQDVHAQTLVQSKVPHSQLGPSEKDILPQWFEHVFDREFDKHVKGFNYLAKRLHQTRFSQQVPRVLTQQRNEPKILQQQLETLVSRASSQKKDKLSNALFLEVNSIQNRITHFENKYKQFLEHLSSKIVEFCRFVESKSIALTAAIDDYAKMLKSQEPGRYEPAKVSGAATATAWIKTDRTEPVGFAASMAGYGTSDYRTSATGFGRPILDPRPPFQPPPVRGYSASSLRPMEVGGFNLSKKLYEDFYY